MIFDPILMEKAKKVADIVNKKGYNIEIVQAFKEGQRILFKRVKKDTVFFTQYFDHTSWDSGVQLQFRPTDSRLKFISDRGRKFRNDKYNTDHNNEIIKNLISDIENCPFLIKKNKQI